MAASYYVVCPNCGEPYQFYSCDRPLKKCGLCGYRLSDGERWSESVTAVREYEDLGKAVADVRSKFFRGRGYKVKLPSGTQCIIKMREWYEFWFSFKVHGEEINALIRTVKLLDKVELMRKRSMVPIEDMPLIIYRGRAYAPMDPAGKALVRAVETNEMPDVAAAIEL